MSCFTSHADLKPGRARQPDLLVRKTGRREVAHCHFFPIRVKQITTSRTGPSENARSRRVQAMKKPDKRIPRWLTIDLMILVVGAFITVASSLWLGINIQRMVVP